MSRRLACFVLLAAWLALGANGCGRGKGSVSGTVTYRGKPVRVGSVVMIGEDNKAHNGAIDDDGKYRVKDVLVGTVKVGVVSPDPASTQPRQRPPMKGPKAKTKELGDMPPSPPSAPTTDRSKWFRLPKQYEVPAESGITTIIERGENTFDIELK
jgi:hypothetical protein